MTDDPHARLEALRSDIVDMALADAASAVASLPADAAVEIDAIFAAG